MRATTYVLLGMSAGAMARPAIERRQLIRDLGANVAAGQDNHQKNIFKGITTEDIDTDVTTQVDADRSKVRRSEEYKKDDYYKKEYKTEPYKQEKRQLLRDGAINLAIGQDNVQKNAMEGVTTGDIDTAITNEIASVEEDVQNNNVFRRELGEAGYTRHSKRQLELARDVGINAAVGQDNVQKNHFEGVTTGDIDTDVTSQLADKELVGRSVEYEHDRHDYHAREYDHPHRHYKRQDPVSGLVGQLLGGGLGRRSVEYEHDRHYYGYNRPHGQYKRQDDDEDLEKRSEDYHGRDYDRHHYNKYDRRSDDYYHARHYDNHHYNKYDRRSEDHYRRPHYETEEYKRGHYDSYRNEKRGAPVNVNRGDKEVDAEQNSLKINPQVSVASISNMLQNHPGSEDRNVVVDKRSYPQSYEEEQAHYNGYRPHHYDSYHRDEYVRHEKRSRPSNVNRGKTEVNAEQNSIEISPQVAVLSLAKFVQNHSGSEDRNVVVDKRGAPRNFNRGDTEVDAEQNSVEVSPQVAVLSLAKFVQNHSGSEDRNVVVDKRSAPHNFNRGDTEVDAEQNSAEINPQVSVLSLAKFVQNQKGSEDRNVVVDKRSAPTNFNRGSTEENQEANDLKINPQVSVASIAKFLQNQPGSEDRNAVLTRRQFEAVTHTVKNTAEDVLGQAKELAGPKMKRSEVSQ